MKSVRHAQRMHALDIDHIEAALLNVATLVATGMSASLFTVRMISPGT